MLGSGREGTSTGGGGRQRSLSLWLRPPTPIPSLQGWDTAADLHAFTALTGWVLPGPRAVGSGFGPPAKMRQDMVGLGPQRHLPPWSRGWLSQAERGLLGRLQGTGEELQAVWS